MTKLQKHGIKEVQPYVMIVTVRFPTSSSYTLLIKVQLFSCLFLNICVHNGVYCVYLTEIRPLNATNFAGEKPQTNSEQQVVLLRNNLSTEKVKGMRHANISWHTFKSFISVSGV